MTLKRQNIHPWQDQRNARRPDRTVRALVAIAVWIALGLIIWQVLL